MVDRPRLPEDRLYIREDEEGRPYIGLAEFADFLKGELLIEEVEAAGNLDAATGQVDYRRPAPFGSFKLRGQYAGGVSAALGRATRIRYGGFDRLIGMGSTLTTYLGQVRASTAGNAHDVWTAEWLPGVYGPEITISYSPPGTYRPDLHYFGYVFGHGGGRAYAFTPTVKVLSPLTGQIVEAIASVYLPPVGTFVHVVVVPQNYTTDAYTDGVPVIVGAPLLPTTTWRQYNFGSIEPRFGPTTLTSTTTPVQFGRPVGYSGLYQLTATVVIKALAASPGDLKMGVLLRRGYLGSALWWDLDASPGTAGSASPTAGTVVASGLSQSEVRVVTVNAVVAAVLDPAEGNLSAVSPSLWFLPTVADRYSVHVIDYLVRPIPVIGTNFIP